VLSGTFQISVTIDESNAQDLGTGAYTLSRVLAIALANGTSTGQANAMVSDRRTLSAGASETLDFSPSTLAGMFNTPTFTAIKALAVLAASSNSNDVWVTRPTNGIPIFAASGDRVAIPAGGALALAWPSNAGIVVTAGTGDLLDIGNSGGGSSVTYDLVVLGTT
jgi:hypothetical protein